MIKQIIQAKEKSLGDFSVHRTLPQAGQHAVGPWVFFDHAGPAVFLAGKGIDVRPHPHINLATVTFLFEGEVLHRDSLGNVQAIKPGEVNLMVAGKGIVHSERESEAVKNQEHTLHALQLWHALPEGQEEIDPAFYHYDAAQIPSLQQEGVGIQVIIGEAYGITSPVKTFCETLYVTASMPVNTVLQTPGASQLAIYILSGEVQIGEQNISPHQMIILEDNSTVEITANSDAQLALIGGEPLGKRFIEWNFVSSRKERIEQAKQDWLAGKFPKVIGDEDEFIPLPE